MRQRLADGWTLRWLDGPDEVPDAVRTAELPVTVPGGVYPALQAAGLIADPHVDDHEFDSTWIGWSDWRFECDLPSLRTERLDLVCHGLDTVCTVAVDGVELGRTENMHRSYRFPLPPRASRLTLDFASAERFAADRETATGGPRPTPFGRPYAAIRKMACNFGWDWGPDLVTAGPWRPVELHAWHTARLESVRPVIRPDGAGWTVEVDVDVEQLADVAMIVAVEVAGVTATAPVRDGRARAVLTVPSAAPWSPAGHGGQPRYPLTVVLDGPEGEIDRWRRQIGFRSVELDTQPDAIGEQFALRVNGRRIVARGVNWIPDHTDIASVGPDRLRQRLTQARDANVDLIRVWGGGVYESDEFYDLCDELGLLVWQDFPFACAAYSEDDRLALEIGAEAAENVARLMTHPSLVLWNGNNENIWGHADWDWTAELAGRGWGAGYYYDLLPGVVAQIDPSRPYWPGSPYSGAPDRHPNDDRYGVSHIWDVWNETEYEHYRGRIPRFAAEFGFEAPPTFPTLRRTFTGDLPATDVVVPHHQKAADGTTKLDRSLAAHFGGRPDNVDDWLFLTQINQARAVRVGVSHLRSHRDRCSGTIWWQLNDCWPGPSWAVVDGDGRRKPAWYALREQYAPHAISVRPRGDGLIVCVVNETDARWAGDVRITRYRFDGTALATATLPLDSTARTACDLTVPDDVSTPTDPARELLRAETGDLRTEWFFRPDRDLAYPRAAYDLELHGSELTVTARTLLRDLCVFADRIDPALQADRMLDTLLPGETLTVDVGVEVADLPAHVVRAVNDIDLSQLRPPV